MPSLLLLQNSTAYQHQPHSMDGMKFSKLAVEFTAMAMLGAEAKMGWSKLHLYALAIELAFKSLALRAGASPADCKKAGHKVSQMITLIEKCGVSVPAHLKRRLNDDEWFKTMVDTRYPIGNTEVFIHSNYPEMIADILEIQCESPLGFEGGTALAEIAATVDQIRSGGRRRRVPRGAF